MNNEETKQRTTTLRRQRGRGLKERSLQHEITGGDRTLAVTEALNRGSEEIPERSRGLKSQISRM